MNNLNIYFDFPQGDNSKNGKIFVISAVVGIIITIIILCSI